MVILGVSMLAYPSKHGYGYPNLLINPNRGGYRRCPRYRWSPVVILGVAIIVFPSKHGYGYPNLLINPDRGDTGGVHGTGGPLW